MNPTPQPIFSQRHSLEALHAWEQEAYGMMITYGMNTFIGEEHGSGNDPASTYAPSDLDVGQWISVARDSGMKYGLLITKHTSGFCLWPSRHNQYHVGNSSNKTNVVEKYVEACRAKGVKPGLYYCLWDNHNRFGSVTPHDTFDFPEDCQKGGAGKYWWLNAHTTPAYWDFIFLQLEELLTQYGEIFEVWIDIPGLIPRSKRNELYLQIAKWQPKAMIVLNNGIGDGSEVRVEYAWPSDIIPMERVLPNTIGAGISSAYNPHKKIEGKNYYLPGEFCDPIGAEWAYKDEDMPRSDQELLGMYLVSRSRKANFLLNVPPDRRGLIPQRFEAALKRFQKNREHVKDLW